MYDKSQKSRMIELFNRSIDVFDDVQIIRNKKGQQYIKIRFYEMDINYTCCEADLDLFEKLIEVRMIMQNSIALDKMNKAERYEEIVKSFEDFDAIRKMYEDVLSKGFDFDDIEFAINYGG